MENEVKTAIENIGRAFEEFKLANDQRLRELEAKGSVDPTLQAKLEKINEDMTAQSELAQKAVQELEAKVNRFALPDGKPGESAEQRAYKSAFLSYLRKGKVMPELEAKSMSVGVDSDGGFLVTPQMAAAIVEGPAVVSPVRAVANVVTISTDAYEIVVDPNLPTAAWVSEVGSRAASTTASLQRTRIQVHEMFANPNLSQTLLDDANVDLESYIGRRVGLSFAKTEGTAFVSGTGVGQPRGFASYSTAATADGTRSWGTIEHVATGTSGTLGTDPNGLDKLMTLLAKFAPAYLPNVKFAMNRALLAQYRGMKTAANTYAWLPDLTGATQGTLLGHGIVVMDDIASLAANSLSVFAADFAAAYTIVDRVGIRVLRDPFSNKPYVGFYTTKRVGGDVVDFNAIKCLKAA